MVAATPALAGSPTDFKATDSPTLDKGKQKIEIYKKPGVKKKPSGSSSGSGPEQTVCDINVKKPGYKETWEAGTHKIEWESDCQGINQAVIELYNANKTQKLHTIVTLNSLAGHKSGPMTYFYQWNLADDFPHSGPKTIKVRMGTKNDFSKMFYVLGKK